MSIVAGDTTLPRARGRPIPTISTPQVVTDPAEETTPKRRRLAMSINRINQALCEAMEKPPLPNGTVFVCRATEDEWNAFSVTEDTVLKTNYLNWFEATGEIHIIESGPYAPHDALMAAFVIVFNYDVRARRWLRSRGGSSNYSGRKYAPDVHYGPAPGTPGAVLPRLNMEWTDFNTIKIEIGVSQGWGEHAGCLDHKARTIWPTVPGVEYVLCVRVNKDYSIAEFKLYDLPGHGREPALERTATPIVPGTTINFDAHRILGIPAGGLLPSDLQGRVFPDPFVLNLHDVVEEARLSCT